jgi:cation diffusion facilitator family transporter
VIAAASGSLAVAGEMMHNLADLLAAVAVLVGIRLAGRKSRTFPYGLYKVENLIALGLAGLVLITAYEIGRNALLAPPASIRAEPWMFALLLLSTAIPLVFSHFELRAGRAAHSPALVADAREYHVHALTTGLAILALASPWLGLPLDRISALLIVLVVLKMGWELLRDAMRVLLDASMEPDTLSRVREVIDADPLVTEVKWVTGRNAGRYRFVEAGLALRGASREKVETGVKRIEVAVREAVPRVERVLLQVEPASSPWVRYAVPLANSGGPVSDHFGEAPCFAILAVRRDDHTVEERREALNPFCGVERGKGMRVAEWLVAQKVDVVLSHEDLHDKGPAYVLRDAGVELRTTKAQDAETAVGAA